MSIRICTHAICLRAERRIIRPRPRHRQPCRYILCRQREIANHSKRLSVSDAVYEATAVPIPGRRIPLKIRIGSEELRILIAELKQGCIHVMQGSAVSNVIIVPAHRFSAGPAVLLDGNVVAEFLKLPEHLRPRNGKEECRIQSLAPHPL